MLQILVKFKQKPQPNTVEPPLRGHLLNGQPYYAANNQNITNVYK